MIQLKSIKLENFRCFKEINLEFNTDIENNLTVLVAPNGQGKTAILDALAYLLAPFFSRLGYSASHLKENDFRKIMHLDKEGIAFKQAPQAPYMRLTAVMKTGDSEEISWDVTKLRDKSERTKEQAPSGRKIEQLNSFADLIIEESHSEGAKKIPVFAYFKTQRSVIWKKPERRRNFAKTFKRLDAYKNALEGTLDYKNLLEWFYYIEDLQRRRQEAVIKECEDAPTGKSLNIEDLKLTSIEMRTIKLAFEKMLPAFSNIRTVTNPLSLVVDVERNGEKTVCSIESQLSDGYKNVIVLVLTLVQRMIEANSAVSDNDPLAILNTEGVVFIDEVDLFLHPSWQQKILGDLRKTFPKIQFIVTTHSPQVISSIPKECVRLITPDRVRELDNPTQGVEIKEILNSVFATSDTDDNLDIIQKLELLKTLTSEGKGDSPEWKNLYESLEVYYGKDYGPLKGVLLHRDFLQSLAEKRSNA